MIEGPRAATSAELPAVIRLANAVFAPDGYHDMGTTFPTLFCDANLTNLRIFLDDGKPVSLVGQAVREVELGGARVRVVNIGSVCTLDEHRGEGLAARLMEDAISTARREGAALALISGGRGLYRRMGCIDAGRFQTVVVERRSRLPRMRCHVREWAPADIGEMAGLQRAERVRFIRGEAETRTLLAAGRIFVRPGHSWVVHSGGKMVAWLSAARPERSSDGTALEVHELAGSRCALLSAMPAILRGCRLPGANINIVSSDIEMQAMAEAFGLAVRTLGFNGTMKIIDPPGLFRSLAGWITERLCPQELRGFRVEAGERTVFSAGSQSLAVDNVGDLAALVFGSMQQAPPALPEGALGDILGRLFPVPLPWYGLNYI